MSKSVKVLLTVVIALAILFMAAWPKLELLKGEEKKTNKEKEKPQSTQIPVHGIIVQPKSLDSRIRVTGSIMANESIEVRSEISGKIQKIYFKEGERAKKGQVLVIIDDQELQAQLEKLKYNKKLLEETEYRQKQLLEREAISQEEYDIALTELNTSLADIKLLEAQISKSVIRAPFNGTIGLRYVSEGSYVTPSTPIANFYEISPAKIDFSVPGKYSNMIKEGEKIFFTVETLDKKFTGEVYAVEPQIDPQTRTLKMRAITPNKDRELLPGQFAQVELVLESVDNALMVPTQAVIPELNGHKVFVYHNGKVDEKKVKVGIRGEKEIEITSGLEKSDTIITTGLLQIRPGVEVNLTSLN